MAKQFAADPQIQAALTRLKAATHTFQQEMKNFVAIHNTGVLGLGEWIEDIDQSMDELNDEVSALLDPASFS